MIFQDLKSADSVRIDLDPAANKLLSPGVISSLDTQDAVGLAVQTNTLP